MGHDSENLVGVPGLDGFAGLILSPVNRAEGELSKHITNFRKKGKYELVLDPQLYCPKSERGQLPNHRYFPNDLDTADINSPKWWQKLIAKLVDEGNHLKVDAICSPAVLPNKYTAEYYTSCCESFSVLAQELKGSAIKPVQTVCMSLKDLAEPNDALRIASIISGSKPPLCYVVVEANVPPRHEIDNTANLFSLMVFISALESSDCPTIVSHCSSEMILMKAAGATNCASGKFFNLRRFTRSRFDEQSEGGGGQLPYWFEQGLIAFLRRADIARLQRFGFDNFLKVGASNNVFALEILEQFLNKPDEPWLALSWRQYLAWFQLVEKELSSPDAPTTVATWLKEAEQRWEELDSKNVLFEERQNTGRWIRPWRQALGDFLRFNG